MSPGLISTHNTLYQLTRSYLLTQHTVSTHHVTRSVSKATCLLILTGQHKCPQLVLSAINWTHAIHLPDIPPLKKQTNEQKKPSDVLRITYTFPIFIAKLPIQLFRGLLLSVLLPTVTQSVRIYQTVNTAAVRLLVTVMIQVTY